MNAIPPVRLLSLDLGASRMTRQNESRKRDELWLGDARDPNSDSDEVIPVFLRLCEPIPLVAELVCCKMARQLGLPCPEVFVVLIEPGALKGSRFAHATERMLAVATQDVGGMSFTQMLNQDSSYAQEMLMQWEHLVPVATLDEWVANPDRNLGNIIYTQQALHIIDHAEAFGGSSRNLFLLSELAEDQFANLLADMVGRMRPAPKDRKSTLEQVRQWLLRVAAELDIPATIASTDILRWETADKEAELVDFVQQRLKLTHELLCKRLGHPQLALST